MEEVPEHRVVRLRSTPALRALAIAGVAVALALIGTAFLGDRFTPVLIPVAGLLTADRPGRRDDEAERLPREAAAGHAGVSPENSEAMLRSIFRAAPTGIGLVVNRVIMEANERLCTMTGYGREELVGRSARMLYATDGDFEFVGREKYAQIARQGAGTVETRWRRKDGHIIDVLLSSAPLDPRDPASGVAFTALDITDRKRAEEERRKSEASLAKSQEMAHIGSWEGDVETGEIYRSTESYRIFGLAPGEYMITYEKFLGFVLPEDRDRVAEETRLSIETGRPYNITYRIRRKDGAIRVLQGWGEPVRDASGQVVRMHGTNQDITERMMAEEALRESEAKFRALTEMTASAILILQDDRVKYANQSTERILGYTREELQAMSPIEAASIVDPLSLMKLNLVRFLRKGSYQYRRYEIKLRAKGGQAKWVDVTTGVIDYEGRPAFLAAGFDITERRQAEERLLASLQEKEVLLKEIHHRVKNNLQVVSSMLSIQSAKLGDGAAADVLRGSQDRVRSMALIHEKLYQSGDLSRIDFGEYVQNLTKHLLRSYGRGNTIKLNIDVSDILLGVDVAIPCGLIINELVTNALKYAFPGERRGAIVVSMRRDGRKCTLAVRDDGIGMPAGFDFRTSSSLGLQLVNTLIGQLEGDMSLDVADGTRFTIRFNDRK